MIKQAKQKDIEQLQQVNFQIIIEKLDMPALVRLVFKRHI